RRRYHHERQGEVKNGIRYFTNGPAVDAFFTAVGWRTRNLTGYAVCHLYDGPGVHNPRHFSRLSNLTTLPTSLYRLADTAPVLEALRFRSFELYGYRGPRAEVPTKPR